MPSQRQESPGSALLAKALALCDQGRWAEALSATEECLQAQPGWPDARFVRAGLYLETGRPLEARAEADQLLDLQPNEFTRKHLLELKQACEAALKITAAREPGAPAPLPLSRNAIRISSADAAGALEIADAWSRRLHAALSARLSPRFDARVRKEDDSQGRTCWIEVLRGSRLQGRVRAAWAPARPGELVIEATSEGLPASRTLLGSACGVLGVLGALAAFAGWIWFVIHDWTRLWNRLLSFSGPAPDRASKLEIAWFFVGWAVGPVFALLGAMMAGDWLDEQVRRIRVKRLDSFAKRELDRILAEEVQRAMEQAAGDRRLGAELGMSGREPR